MSHPAVISLVLVLVAFGLGVLFLKAGPTPSDAVDSKAAKRAEASAAAVASREQREQARLENAARAQVPRPKGRPLRIAFLGDSTTRGLYVTKPRDAVTSLLTSWFRAQMPVFAQNVDVPGHSLQGALSSGIPSDQDVVFLIFGASEAPGTTRSEYQKNYALIVARAHQRSPNAQIVCVSQWTTSDFAGTEKRVCANPKDETVVDISKTFSDTKNRSVKGARYSGGIVPDKYHLNDRGHQVIAKTIETMIQITR